MDLRDRAGGERLRVHRLEDVLPRDAELLLHHRDDLRLAERRHVVLQGRELFDELGREQVRARRKDLPELAERGAELLQSRAQPLGLASPAHDAFFVGPAEELRRPCFAKTTPIFVPRATRCGRVTGSRADERITVPEAGLRTAVVWPFVVFTMITVQRALWLIRFGTLPSRNSLRPAIPAFPTTSTSTAWSSEERTIAIAGSSSITTCACPRSPASWVV